MLNKTISNRLDETQIFYFDSRVCFVSFIVIDRMLSMHDHLNTRATTKKKRGGVQREEDHVRARSSRPSEQEQIEHEMMHLPCHSWCRYGIMGRGQEEDCRLSYGE